MTRAPVSALSVTAYRDAFDFHLRPAQQGRPDRGTRRLVGPEPLGVNLVHRLEVFEIGEEHGRLRNAGERRFGGDEDGSEIVEDASRLGADVVAADELPGLRVERKLPGAEHEVA